MRLELDKKVFNVEKNIVSAGGTAVDVMRNVPSVNVDIDGNVSLRGQSPTIYVDGRPTTLTLDEIPADAIESVEVMTNPSAKYDASGGGSGILNIVLKKNRKQGYNGNISAGVDSHGAPNAMVNFNIRQNKININAIGLYNGQNGKTTGNTSRYTYLGDTSHLTGVGPHPEQDALHVRRTRVGLLCHQPDNALGGLFQGAWRPESGGNLSNPDRQYPGRCSAEPVQHPVFGQ